MSFSLDTSDWAPWAQRALMLVLFVLAGWLLAAVTWIAKDVYMEHKGIKEWSVRHEAEALAKADVQSEAIGSMTRVLSQQLEVDREHDERISELEASYRVLRDRSDRERPADRRGG
ncbi:MAG: hypothetical protein ACQGVC_17105 [Myxococcota bacterium]